MNREIKFRVWDYQNNRWAIDKDISGSIGLVFGTNDYFINIAGEKSLRFAFMQFTGLKDKNGLEIYEGDVVMNEMLKGFIKYLNCSFMIEWIGEDCYSDLLGWYSYKRGTPAKPEDFEVIGNIYQHPELLNQSKK